jgi:hypothetical protein
VLVRLESCSLRHGMDEESVCAISTLGVGADLLTLTSIFHGWVAQVVKELHAVNSEHYGR